MNLKILPMLSAAILLCNSVHLAQAQQNDEQEADAADAEEPEYPDCPKAELAADRVAARTYVVTAAQLAGLTEAGVELRAASKKQPSLGSAVNQFRCREDESTVTITTAGVGKYFAKFPAVAKIYSGHGIAARDVGIWAFLSVSMIISATPEIAAMAPEVAAEAKKLLTAQQATFARQNAAGLRKFVETGKEAR